MSRPCFCAAGPALTAPYYECSRCGLDYDDATFYRIKQSRRNEELHAIPHRDRAYDTICKACRQEERDALKGPPPVLDRSMVTRPRYMRMAYRTLHHHSVRFKRPLEYFYSVGITVEAVADLLQKSEQCFYCRKAYHSLDDISLDFYLGQQAIAVPFLRVADRTCNAAKAVFEKDPNAAEKIEWWRRNWERHEMHQVCVTQTVPPLKVGTLDVVGFFDNKGDGYLFDPAIRAPEIRVPSMPTPFHARPSRPPQIGIWGWICHRCCLTDDATHERCPRCGHTDSPC